MKNQKFRKLDVWNRAMDFISEIYRLTNRFPPKEQYGLTSQICRAATSIAMSIRSCYELMCGIEIAERLGYCTVSEKETILEKSDEISAMLTGLKKGLSRNFEFSETSSFSKI